MVPGGCSAVTENRERVNEQLGEEHYQLDSYHVVFPHEVRQILPGNNLVVLSQLVHRHQLVARGQRGLRAGVERSVRVQRGGVGRPGSGTRPLERERGNFHWSLTWSLHPAPLPVLHIPGWRGGLTSVQSPALLKDAR